ncbi:MAG: hypothetical protein FJY65_11195 [Calditrichaeota bacterium]|nr:hypothetical protein [Calditrichota bacterium]
MHYEKVNEVVEVIAHFVEGAPRPLRFLWRGKAHRVEAVNGRWTSLEGRQKTFHYAVSAADIGQCELALDVERMAWRVASVAVE